MRTLTSSAFTLLLLRLDSDEAIAVKKYELLRQKLIKIISLKSGSEAEADALTDIVIDRVAGKLEKGEEIHSLNAYVYEVMRFVLLEYYRRRKEDLANNDFPEIKVQPDIEILYEPNIRMRCLHKCLLEMVPDARDKKLIIEYYGDEPGKKNKQIRKKLAEKLGLKMNALKTRACRIRERLEKCINECVARMGVTKIAISDTDQKGDDVR